MTNERQTTPSREQGREGASPPGHRAQGFPEGRGRGGRGGRSHRVRRRSRRLGKRPSSGRTGCPGRHLGDPARTRLRPRPPPRRPAHRQRSDRLRRGRRHGHRARPQPGAHRRVRGHSRLRHPRGPCGASGRPRRGGGTPPARPLHERRDRLRAPLRRGRPRPRLHRDPLALARPHLRRGHGERQARGHRGPRRVHHRRLLATRGDRRAHRPSLRDDGERQLRARRTALPQPCAAGPAGRGPTRRVRIPARPARHQVRRRRRGTLAPRPLLDPKRQPLPHARARSGRQLHGHQPRGPVRLPRLHEQSLARTPGMGGRQLPGRPPQARRDLRAGRRERQPHPDGSRKDHLRRPRHESPPPL